MATHLRPLFGQGPKRRDARLSPTVTRMTKSVIRVLRWASPTGHAFGRKKAPGTPPSLLRSFEIFQIGRCLIFLCRHQEAIRAQEVVFLANDNIHVALIA